MILKCLGSSSLGNSYILQSSKGESLILECGVNILEVKKALNFNLSGVVGALSSHGHNDHFGRAKDFCRAGIDVYVEEQNRERHVNFNSHRLKFFTEMKDFKVGSFKVKSFPLIHDLPTVGFLIEQKEMGRLVFITDTAYSNYFFPGLNHILIEANYSLDILNQKLINGHIDGYLRNRVMGNHLEFGETKNFLLSNNLSEVRTISLLHLSDSNSDASRFKRETEELTGKPCFIADKGTVVNLSLNTF